MVRRHSNEEVELNVASMLDMAFQLLAFFIMTFKPPPNECAIQLRMPPPQAAVGVQGGKPAGEEEGDPSRVQPVITLSIQLGSRADGSLAGMIKVGMPNKPNEMEEVSYDERLNKLNTRVADWFSKGGFEQVLIMAAPDLHWSEVLRVIDVCSKQRLSDGKLPRLNFRSMGRRAPST